MISVLMSVYNESPQWVSEAVESVLNQTYGDFEFIIVIDNPGLPDEVKNYLIRRSEEDGRIVLLFNSSNIGLAASLNMGIEAAKGEYIARMDADDISLPARFERELEFIAVTGSDVVGANKICIGENGEALYNNPPLERYSDEMLKYTNFIVHPSVLMKTASVRACGGYRLMRNSEDLDLWLRMADSGYKISFMNEYLIRYRIRSTSASVERQLEQYHIANYTLKCQRQRKKSGKDSYSPENLSKYLGSKKMGESQKKKFALSAEYCAKAKRQFRERHFAGGTVSFFRGFAYDPGYTVSRIVRNILLKRAEARAPER